MELIKHRSDIVDLLLKPKSLVPLNILDLGCSGGPDDIFTQLKNFFYLRWIGIDFNQEEIERLRSLYSDESFLFFSNKISTNRINPIENNTWEFFSASYAANLVELNSLTHKEIVDNNLWSSKEVKKSQEPLALSNIVSDSDLDFDLLKIDLDGNDFSFLLDFFQYSRKDPKFVVIETNFYGGASDDSTSFCNQDKFLKKKGYTLGGIKPRNYSLKELPGEFVYSIFAQTNYGVPYQADCLYFKEPEQNLDLDSLLVYIVLFESFNLPDHSAKLILNYSKILSNQSVSAVLDKLTDIVWGSKFSSYEELITRFSNDPSVLFKSTPSMPTEPARVKTNYSPSVFLKKFKNFLK